MKRGGGNAELTGMLCGMLLGEIPEPLRMEVAQAWVEKCINKVDEEIILRHSWSCRSAGFLKQDVPERSQFEVSWGWLGKCTRTRDVKLILLLAYSGRLCRCLKQEIPERLQIEVAQGSRRNLAMHVHEVVHVYLYLYISACIAGFEPSLCMCMKLYMGISICT